MIRFVCGRSGSGKSEYIMDGLRAADPSGGMILIVPEQQAVAWESRTARELSPKTLMSLEVLTFTRLGDRVAREYGGFFHNCATKPAKQLIMWAALESVRGVFSYYSGAKTERLAASLLNTVKELRTYRVTPAELEAAADKLEGGERAEELLSHKLRDISAVYAAYESLLHESYNDSDELPEHTAKTVSENGFFAGRSVFIDSFYSVTPAQYDIIRAAMRDAAELTVTFACPSEDTGEPQFAHIREHYDRMRRMASEYGGYETVALNEQKRFTSPALGVLERSIWSFGTRNAEISPEGITLIGTRDRYSEADAAAARICGLVRDGARYSDIAVIARSTDALCGIIDTALERRGIPHYISRRRALAGSPAARLMTSSLRAVSYGWRAEDILGIVKTGLLPIGGDGCDLTEKYIKMWHIRGRRAYDDGEAWGMSPFGYKQANAERSARILEEVNAARRIIGEALSKFAEIFEGGRVRADKCAEALYTLLTDWNIPDSIGKTAEQLRELGYTTEAAEQLRLWDALMSVLDTLATAMPDAEGDAESFTVMLSQIIAATDVGTIPTGIDEVSVGSADMMRMENPKHVIILGALAGEFPASVPKDGILSESDRIMLEGCGIELSDGGVKSGGKELFWFYKALSAPSESVTVIVPRYSGGGAAAPSIGVARIRELFADLTMHEYSMAYATESVWVREDLDRFLRDGGVYGSAARSLAKTSELPPLYGEDRRYDPSNERISPEIMHRINGDVLTFTQTKIEKYARCPFMYSAMFTLGLEGDSEARIDTSDTGSFVHKLLEKFFRETADMEFPVPEAVEREICDRLFSEYADRLGERGAVAERQRFLLRRLRVSIGLFVHSLNEEFGQGLFRPWRFEQSVGGSESDSIPAPEFILEDGTVLKMRGNIDRIDVFREDGRTYVRVVDYKTGSKEFSLSDIYNGVNLQLLLYLFTVWKLPPCKFRTAVAGDGEIVPAGALYFSARPGETTSDMMLYGDDGLVVAQAAVSRTGIVLSDRHILEAMDRELSGKYAPVGVDRNGELKQTGSLAGFEDFERLYRDISDIVKELGGRMAKGFAEAKPKEYKGNIPCEYCDYGAVCRRGVATEEEKS